MAFDNALWHDRVADPAQRDAETTAIREVHPRGGGDDQLVPALLPVGDGLLVAKKEWLPEGTDGPTKRGRSALNPPAPSATATMSQGSMRTGGAPMIREPGDSAAVSVNVSWNAVRAASSSKT